MCACYRFADIISGLDICQVGHLSGYQRRFMSGKQRACGTRIKNFEKSV
ncbi:hypothetical protein JT333_gp61 [Serratia phage KpYy 1 41]|nr:hypothetical protein JT333_gp61 [Serratia phage KpYy 1 41]